MERVNRLFLKFLSKKPLWQLTTCTFLFLLVMSVSYWQQFLQLENKKVALTRILQEKTKEHYRLRSELHGLQIQTNEATETLSNDEIANRFEQWASSGKAQIQTLDFSRDQFSKTLDIARIRIASIVTLPDIFSLLDSHIGNSIFIDTIVVRINANTEIELDAYMVQAIPDDGA